MERVFEVFTGFIFTGDGTSLTRLNGDYVKSHYAENLIVIGQYEYSVNKIGFVAIDRYRDSVVVAYTEVNSGKDSRGAACVTLTPIKGVMAFDMESREEATEFFTPELVEEILVLCSKHSTKKDRLRHRIQRELDLKRHLRKY